MNRIGMLAGLLVLALGTGVAAQSPSPEASAVVTPTYAPEDIASALPSSFGEWEVDIGTDRSGFDHYEQQYRDLLRPFDKSLDDLRGAMGYGYRAGDEAALAEERLAFQIGAFRVVGVPASSLVEPWVRVMREGAPPPMTTHMTTEWRVIDGRDVYALVPTPDAWPEWEQAGVTNREFGFYYFTEGEVLFFVLIPGPAGSPSLTEILAEMPR